MKDIYFASKNRNKLEEIRSILPSGYTVKGIQDLVDGELEETGDTLEANALQKARFIHQLTGKAAFADDTGLEVPCLKGAPGVHSAHFGGMERSSEKNIAKLLADMAVCSDRSAWFRTIIAFVSEGMELIFEGRVEGQIITAPRGGNGFGYDPVFVPEGETRTFAEMDLNEKNKFSHRARAMKRFLEHLSAAPC